jgi:formylglycine-generating enzyme required for sulfatase activity
MRRKTRGVLLILLVAATVLGVTLLAQAIDDEPSPPPKPPPPTDPCKALWKEAVEALNQGERDAGVALLERIVKKCPNTASGRQARDKLDSLRATDRTPEPPTPKRPKVATSGLVKMVQVPAGRFLMGSPSDEPGRDDDEGPQHSVTISRPFLIGATEVTQGQWRTVMGSNPSHFSSCGDECPVESVNWHEAVDFCNRLSDREGLSRCYQGVGENVTWNHSCTGYRLPTEAEWEYAARAGSTTPFASGRISASGNDCQADGNLEVMGWYCQNSGSKTHPVGQKQANAWGLYDMQGNVWEWVWDWKGNYPSGSVTDPTGPGGGSGRVLRGGSWLYVARFCRSANRDISVPGDRDSGLGFRLSRSVP